MMGRKDDYQSNMEFIDLNTFVHSNHILRQINEKIDFSFIYNKSINRNLAENHLTLYFYL